MWSAPAIVVDLPVVQAGNASSFVAFRTSGRAFYAFPLPQIGVMVGGTIASTSAVMPEMSRTAGYALRPVRARARFAGFVTRPTPKK